MATPKKPNAVRGRPRIPLAERDERHWLAFLSAALDHDGLKDRSERSLLLTFTALRLGRPVETPENIERMRLGLPFLVATTEAQTRAQPRRNAGQRHTNPFRPHADDEGRRLRAIRTAASDDPDRKWLALMTKAWLACLYGDMTQLDAARAWAGMAGEADHFAAVMEPIIRRELIVAPLIDALGGKK